MSRIILLGAGASHGSGDVTPHTPPLGGGLYAGLASRGGIAAELPPAVRDAFLEHFETGMAAYMAHSGDDTMRFQRELAAYVASFVPGPSNEYARLIRLINPNRCVIGTLNYDLLIEFAAGLNGLDIQYGGTMRPGALRLLKLHGSCNFWPEIRGRWIGCTFAGNAVDVNAPIRYLSPAETINECATQDSFAPSMALYAEGKRVKVCPGVVQAHQECWSEVVSSATTICVAGTYLNSADKHIWEPIAKSRGHLHYFGLAGDRALFEEWKTQTGRKNATFNEACFADAVPEIARLV